MTDFNSLKTTVETLIDKAGKAADANDAMKFTQAATNAGQALYALRDIGGADEGFRRRVASEIDKLNSALVLHMNANNGDDHPALRAAQQALCWAVSPEMSKQPIKMIMGEEWGTTLGESIAGLGQASPPPEPLRAA